MTDPGLATGTPAGSAGAGPRPGARASRPTPLSLWWGQVRYANRQFWRNPAAAFFTLAFPLLCLIVISGLYGNAVVDESTGLRLAQYLTPVFAVYGACMACYFSMASIVAYSRAAGVLKRLAGTPVPRVTYVTGRMGSGAWLAGIAVALMVTAGVAVYGVQIIWANVPALLLTFVVGTSCFAALGLAVVFVAPTPAAATAFANLTLIIGSFVSGIFGVMAWPGWIERVVGLLPLKPFVVGFQRGFDPAADGSSPDWSGLAVMAAWAVLGIVVVWRRFAWEAAAGGDGGSGGSGGAAASSAPDEAAALPTPARALGAVRTPGRPGWPVLLRVHTRYAVVQIRRDFLGLFFAVIFPVLLLVFQQVGQPADAQWRGVPLAQYLAAALSVYGLAVTGVVNLPEPIAEHRMEGILKRLRGTPSPPWAYLSGRILAAVLYGYLTVALVFAVAVVGFGASLPVSRWPATALVYLLVIVCFASCGMALLAVFDRPQALTAVGLGVVLPVSFISEILIQVEQMPAVLDVISWIFPLRHAAVLAVTVTSGGPVDAALWGHVAVLLLWTSAAALAAWRWFRWEPRAGRAAPARRPNA